MAEVADTKSAALALADERDLMRQGYEFLDEKRMLLAAEMLRALARHRALEAQLLDALQQARAALRRALQRHGLGALQAYPPAVCVSAPPATARSLFLGVPLLGVIATPGAQRRDDDAVDASPEALACALAFADLSAPLARLGASSGNLERLSAEYRRTERRARALENVLLPEIAASLKAVQEHLDVADQEEAVRVRLARRRR